MPTRCLQCGHLFVDRDCSCPCHKTFLAEAERLGQAIEDLKQQVRRRLRKK